MDLLNSLNCRVKETKNVDLFLLNLVNRQRYKYTHEQKEEEEEEEEEGRDEEVKEVEEEGGLICFPLLSYFSALLFLEL